jgi:SOS-response transcriptional repressor LexA
MRLPVAIAIGEGGTGGTAVRFQRVHDLDRVLQFIIAYKAANDGNSPSLREIGPAVGISSTSVVVYQLVELERAGLISRTGTNRRQIVVTGGQWSMTAVACPGQ